MTTTLLNKCFNFLENYWDLSNSARKSTRFPAELFYLYNNEYVHILRILQYQKKQELKIYHQLNDLIKDKFQFSKEDYLKLLKLRKNSHNRLFTLTKDILFLTHCTRIKNTKYFQSNDNEFKIIKNKYLWVNYDETI